MPRGCGVSSVDPVSGCYRDNGITYRAHVVSSSNRAIVVSAVAQLLTRQRGVQEW